MKLSAPSKTRFTFHFLRCTNKCRWLMSAICSLLLVLAPAAPSAAYKSEWVNFPALEEFNGRPVQLDALVYRPAGQGPFPALVLMHGCSGMYASNGNVTRSYLHWLEVLAGNGFVAALVDSF